jgi:hypothetical protein
LDLILGTHHLSSVGGAETYLLTVAEQLQRFSHRVTLFGSDGGEMARFLERRGLRVVIGESGLPDTCDALIVQDAVTALTLAERYPSAPQVFVAHAPNLEMWFPPSLPGVVSAVIVLNDRVRSRVEAMAGDHDVVRLRQPIDIQRFGSRDPLPGRPRRLVMLGNYLFGARRAAVVDVCEAAGIQVVQVGRHGQATFEPEREIVRGDIVVGHGRSLLEGMACARASYVLDDRGGDGWITPDRYAVLEADGFTGSAFDEVVDSERLARDLRAYRPEMGLANRDLILRHHNAASHVSELARLLKRVASRRTRPDAVDEIARLSLSQWRAEGRAAELRVENQELRRELAKERARAATALADAGDARRQLVAVTTTRRYRFARLIARPLDFLRRVGAP